MSTIVDKKGLPELPRKEAHLKEYARIRDPQTRVEIYAQLVKEVGPENITAELIASKVAAHSPQPGKPVPAVPKLSWSTRLKQARGIVVELRAAVDGGQGVKALLDRLERTLAG